MNSPTGQPRVNSMDAHGSSTPIKYLFAPPAQMAGGQEAIEIINHLRRRPVAFSSHYPGQLADVAAADRLNHLLGNRFAFASDHAVDGTPACLRMSWKR